MYGYIIESNFWVPIEIIIHHSDEKWDSFETLLTCLLKLEMNVKHEIIKGTVHPKNKNLVIIYSPMGCSKSVKISLF